MGLRGRTSGATIGLAAAFLSLKPVGPLDRALNMALLPTRIVASTGLMPSALLAGGPSASEEERALERDLSNRLERAVLSSAWPVVSNVPAEALPIPGEVDARQGSRRDHIMVRVADAAAVMPGHPVVSGDVYVGSVERIPSRQPARDDPGFLERVARRVGLSSPPQKPPAGIVEVALITGARARVGATIHEDQDGRSSDLVVGGLVPRADRIWLSAHNPESRATVSGTVYVHGLFERSTDFDSLAEGFLIGELKREAYSPDGDEVKTEVLGIQPLVDFESGLNQVLILTSAGRGAVAQDVRAAQRAATELAVPVLDDGGWVSARLLAPSDTSSWRSALRVAEGSRDGVVPGAALVEGVRLVGRVERADSGGSRVALLDDPGFEIAVLAQSELDPDAVPLVLGAIRHDGSPDGALEFTWTPEGGSLHAEWILRHREGESAPVRIWTGSGMVGVPRGLLVGRTLLPVAPAQEDEAQSAEPLQITLEITGTGSIGGRLMVRTRQRTAPGGSR